MSLSGECGGDVSQWCGGLCGLLCVVAEEGSVGSVLKVSVFIQTTAHDVMLLFSNIAWFLSSVVVHDCGHFVGSVDHHVRVGTAVVFHLVDFVS